MVPVLAVRWDDNQCKNDTSAFIILTHQQNKDDFISLFIPYKTAGDTQKMFAPKIIDTIDKYLSKVDKSVGWYISLLQSEKFKDSQIVLNINVDENK